MNPSTGAPNAFGCSSLLFPTCFSSAAHPSWGCCLPVPAGLWAEPSSTASTDVGPWLIDGSAPPCADQSLSFIPRVENTTLQQQHPASVGPGASVLLLGSALAMGALQNQASIFGVSQGWPDGTAVLLPPRDPQGCHPHWDCWLQAVIFTEGFQTDPLKAGRLLSSPYLIAVFTHPSPPSNPALIFNC